jgi:hypothetical protein
MNDWFISTMNKEEVKLPPSRFFHCTTTKPLGVMSNAFVNSFLNVFGLSKDTFFASSTFPGNPVWRPSDRKLIYAWFCNACQTQFTLCDS